MRGVPTSHNDPEALALRLREYCKLYKHFAAGVVKACDTAKIGGPSLDNDLLFLDGFLRTVHDQGIKIDFVGIHPYGKLSPVHAENNLRVHEANQSIIDRYFPETARVRCARFLRVSMYRLGIYAPVKRVVTRVKRIRRRQRQA